MEITHLVTKAHSQEQGRYQAERVANFQIPYDEAPFAGTVQPGEKIKLYGGVEIENHTGEPCHISMRFDLHHGFIATLEGAFSSIHFDVNVPMHSQHAIMVVNGAWELVARNATYF